MCVRVFDTYCSISADYVHRQTIEFNMQRSHDTYSAVQLFQSEHDGYKYHTFGAGEEDVAQVNDSHGDEGDDDGYGKRHNGTDNTEAHSNDDHCRDSDDEHSEDGNGNEE